VTDACVLLGYIDPDYFLGGTIALRRGLAEEAVARDVGKPLGLGGYEAAAAIWSVAVEQMVNGIEEITLNQGVDAREAVLVGGGGGAGLYSVEVARRLGVPHVVIPRVAAALSACGAVFSDLRASYAHVAPMSTAEFDYDRCGEVVHLLTDECAAYVLRAAGSNTVDSTIAFSVEARYPDQVWEIEVPLRGSGIETSEDVAAFLEDFHRVHDELFAHSDPQSPVEIVMWRAEARCRLRPASLGARPSGTGSPVRATREGFFEGEVVQAPAYAWDCLPVGEPVRGPAFVDSTNETVVLPPFAFAQRTESDSLLVVPGRVGEGAGGVRDAAIASVGLESSG